MDTTDANEFWRIIPPEEKLELLSKSHARGIVSAITAIIVGSTLAVGFKWDWFLWGSMLISPLIFQFASGKEWRKVKPQAILKYLAARSAARRYAFAAQSKDLSAVFMFRGYLERLHNRQDVSDEIESIVEGVGEVEVWITLFRDCIIMMSERPGGAELKFGYLINEKMTISGRSPDGDGDYSNNREVFIAVQEKKNEEKRFKITSKFPAALVVFEKKALEQQRELLRKFPAAEILDDDLPPLPMEDEDDDFFSRGRI